MKRFILVCILILSVTGCSEKFVDTNEKAGTNLTRGTENAQSNQTVSSFPISSPDNSINFKSDFDSIKEIMSNKKEDVLKKLGKDYEIVKKGDLPDRLKYKKYGISVVVEESLASTDKSVALVECDDKVDIKGAKLGMTFAEIEKILGNGTKRPIKKIEPDDAGYALTYRIDDLAIWFGSDTDDGPTTKLQIRRYSGPK